MQLSANVEGYAPPRRTGAAAMLRIGLLLLVSLCAEAAGPRPPLPPFAEEAPQAVNPTNPVLIATVLTGLVVVLGAIGLMVMRGSRSTRAPGAEPPPREPALRGGPSRQDNSTRRGG